MTKSTLRIFSRKRISLHAQFQSDSSTYSMFLLGSRFSRTLKFDKFVHSLESNVRNHILSLLLFL